MATGETKTTYHLVMNSADEFHPRYTGRPEITVAKLTYSNPGFNWFMYQSIGPRYRWGGRETWTEFDWKSFVTNPAVMTWGAYLEGTPIGYYEVELTKSRQAKVHCIGLQEPFTGQGLGGHLVSHCIDQCWKLNPRNIILKTCSHDHPHALPNYLKRGFQLTKTTTDSANPIWTSKLFMGFK